MTSPQPPPFDSIDYDDLMEQDFQAANLNLETITDILADAFNDHPQ